MTPEVQHIVITRSDGGLSVMNFVTHGLINETEVFTREATVENINAEIVKMGIKVVSWRRIKLDDLPADRTYRDAWTDTGKIEVDMSKARGIHLDRIRALREPLFADLDIAYQRADENGDAEAKAAIAARKQALRDATKDPAIHAAKTPEELKAAIPDVMKG